MNKFLLNPSGLALLDAMGTSFDIFLTPIEKDSKRLWLVHIKTEESEEIGILSNTRGEIRYFKDINTAIDLIKKHCPKFDDIHLALLPSGTVKIT